MANNQIDRIANTVRVKGAGYPGSGFCEMARRGRAVTRNRSSYGLADKGGIYVSMSKLWRDEFRARM